MSRRMLVLSSFIAMILVGSLVLGVQQASAFSVGESGSYLYLTTYPNEAALRATWKTLGYRLTSDGLAYRVTAIHEFYSYDGHEIGTQLIRRDLSSGLVSVATSKLLSWSIDFTWYDQSGKVIRHHVTSLTLKYIGGTAVADCVAYILRPDTPQRITAHFEISGADVVTTQHAPDYQTLQNYEIGQTYRFYTISWDHGQENWRTDYDDMELVGKEDVTVTAGTFLSYQFHRSNPWSEYWNRFSDEYVMVGSKTFVYGADDHTGDTFELMKYHHGRH